MTVIEERRSAADELPLDPSLGTGSAVGDDPKPRSGDRNRLFLLIGTVVGAILLIGGGLWWLHARQFVSTDDAFIDGDIVHVSAQVSGRVARLLVDDNEPVAAGQLLAEIDPADIQATLDEARAGERQAEAEWAQARTQVAVSQANLEQVAAQIDASAADAGAAEREYQRTLALQRVNATAVTQQQVDTTGTAAATAAARLRAARKQEAAAAAQVSSAEAAVHSAAARRESAQAQVRAAELTLSHTKLFAPVAGMSAKRAVTPGAYVEPGEDLMAVVPRDLFVTANFKETQLGQIRVGQAVDLHVDAYPDVAFHGRVESIQPGAGQAFALLPSENATGNFVKIVQRVPVKIRIDRPDRRYVLGPGMSVTASVHIDP